MPDTDEPVVLTTVPTETQAAILVAVLRDEEIDALTTGGLTSGWRAEAPGGVQVLVRRGDLERAKWVLKEAERTEPPDGFHDDDTTRD